MKKGIAAIDKQIDSVTAYRENRGPKRPISRLSQWTEEEAARDRERREFAETRDMLNNPRSRITSIQGERVNSGYYDEPFGYCG